MHKNFKSNKMTIESMLTCSQKCSGSSCGACANCNCRDTVNNYGIYIGLVNSTKESVVTNLLVTGASIG